MKDVIVYQCGTVFADGVLLTHVLEVTPPFSGGNARDKRLPSISVSITGTLTYKANAYVKPLPPMPPMPGKAPIHPDTERVTKVRQRIESMTVNGDLSIEQKNDLLSALL